MRNNFDPTVSWRDLDFIRAEWSGPLVIKGILDKDDAVAAAEIGADGIVVSNHGGRQLDGVLSTARALPPIAKTVGDRLTVLADGSVRSGLDVVCMLALGAKGVLLGRAWAYALAAAGEKGVAHMLALVEAEMRVAMALTACRSIGDIGPQALVTLNLTFLPMHHIVHSNRKLLAVRTTRDRIAADGGGMRLRAVIRSRADDPDVCVKVCPSI